jgi:hypothetical protein
MENVDKKLSIDSPMLSFQALHDHAMKLEAMIERIAGRIEWNLQGNLFSLESSLDGVDQTPPSNPPPAPLEPVSGVTLGVDAGQDSTPEVVSEGVELSPSDVPTDAVEVSTPNAYSQI